ncbi:MAG: DUF6622 family protein [Sphingomonadaceae bacterium]
MLQQIISHTPTYVWAILAFLIYRGVQACRDRVTSLRGLFIIPLVMLVLALQDLAVKFGLNGLTAGLWLLGLTAGAVLAWQLIDAGRIQVNRADGTVVQRGSVLPLLLMLAIFLTKYSVAVLFAVLPALHQSSAFLAVVCVLFGLFNGIFAGRLARYLSVWRQPTAALAA